MYYHGLSWRIRHGSSLDIDIDEDDILDSISTDKLVKVVARRRKELEEHPEDFYREEQWRKEWVETISVDLDEYDLMYQDDESIDHFSNDEIINYLEKQGYQVAVDEDDNVCGQSLSKLCSDYFFNHTKFKNKEFLLDILDLGSYATDQDIIDRIKEIIH